MEEDKEPDERHKDDEEMKEETEVSKVGHKPLVHSLIFPLSSSPKRRRGGRRVLLNFHNEISPHINCSKFINPLG